ncbi:MAG: DUF2442 domain-containing protein [Schwartzia sp.]|nr:DUF2442 domain-containing protein [Schwartzia sp. (in: firmicutes)]
MSELTSVPLLDVKPLADYRLDLLFVTQERKVFDVSPYIKGSWYGELKDPDYFSKVRIHPELKDTVMWPHEQDIAPHELYELSTVVS